MNEIHQCEESDFLIKEENQEWFIEKVKFSPYWQTFEKEKILKIKYCPFCGKKLAPLN